MANQRHRCFAGKKSKLRITRDVARNVSTRQVVERIAGDRDPSLALRMTPEIAAVVGIAGIGILAALRMTTLNRW